MKMGRGRGKGRKPAVSNNDDPGSGEEERIPVQKRRGRPQKSVKDEMNEEADKIEGLDSENGINQEARSPLTENGKKRKQNSEIPESKDEKGTLPKPNGFRHNGNRRKSTPRRAAEAGVGCD